MATKRQYRTLTDSEIQQLEAQGSSAADWRQVLVSGHFDPRQVRGSRFEGAVRLGDSPTIVDVRLLSGYTLGDHVTLRNIGEMTATADAEVWLDVMNENGGRRVMAVPGMTVGEAYLWARYRGRKQLMQRLADFSRESLGGSRYGIVGDGCTVLNTVTIRNVALLSSADDPTTVDTCIALVDGVAGSGCTLRHGVIAERFLLGEHVHLAAGLRLNDTVVGDNSTLARGEVGCSVIFPAHEQHHNNSFLIAALVMGQSNVAAGATIGSNHNSRTADGELAAGRGFWPGLCTSFKHSSRFASFCLLAKGDYPAELNIPLPFSLVNNDTAAEELEVMPAYWWMYNMYALDRNNRKFAARDKRLHKVQHIEFAPLAPDTAEEILAAVPVIEECIRSAREGAVQAHSMEKSHRPTVIRKVHEGLQAYREMLLHYAMTTLRTAYGDALPPQTLAAGDRQRRWDNIGGQLVAGDDMDRLLDDTESGAIGSWASLRQRLDELWLAYPARRAAHAYHVLCLTQGTAAIDDATWQRCLRQHEELLAKIASSITTSRQKDHDNVFRQATFMDDAERDAVMGTA